MFNSTFVANTAALRGGAIYNTGQLTVINSTLTSNLAASGGGGIDNGAVYILDADGDVEDVWQVGGRPVTLSNTIVAGSAGGADVAVGNDFLGTLAGSHNFIGDGSIALPNTITGDPLLGLLTDNGGPTKTRAPLAGSPVLDAGTNPAFPQPTAAPGGVNLTNFTSNGALPDNTTFSYRVSAYNGMGETFSMPVTTTTGSSGSQANAVLVDWEPVPGAWIYAVYRRSPQGVEELLTTAVTTIFEDEDSAYLDYGRRVLIGTMLEAAAIGADQRGEPFDRVVRGTRGLVNDYVGLSEIKFGESGGGPIFTAFSAFASSYYSAEQWPNHVIDGSGLDTSSGIVPFFTHAPHPNANGMWHAGAGQGVGGAAPIVNNQYIVFQLEENVDISDVYLWQMVQPGLLGRGIKEFRLLASPNVPNPADAANPPAEYNLTGYTEILGVTELAAAEEGESATTQVFPVTGATNVRTIYLDIISSYSTASRIDIGAVESQSPPADYYGDYNRDGSVDAADYIVWRKWLGATGVVPYSGADGDGNGRIEQADYTVWRSNFGQTLPIEATANGAGEIALAEPESIDKVVVTQDYRSARTASIETSVESTAKAEPGVDWALHDVRSPRHDPVTFASRQGNRLAVGTSINDQLLSILASDRVKQSSQSASSRTFKSSHDDRRNDYLDGQIDFDDLLTLAAAESIWDSRA